MSDQGEKTCPLCAEEMDFTDQQLKPCKCGYEICVWCWHQLLDLAEKDEAEGRCPACRTPYDKDKIVRMAESNERLVAEIHMEKKQKAQKAKTKMSESRKQLNSVRVIQRNLVYISGLPLDLADEDRLQQREYFGQYGKVLKVSISRTSAGTIQQFANNTCSVYITYSKEEEAVRCIQSVHAFILDGRPLKACFGTTKYCHAWLRNSPCSNPECLYLHEVGSQEDSFTKDEIISAYSRVQQITGVTNNMQRRSGDVLPPPADDYCNNSSAVTVKPIVKASSNTSASCTKVSPPNSSSGRSGALPAAASWGARCNPPTGSSACSNGPIKQKTETINGPEVLATTVSGSVQSSNHPNDAGKKQLSNEETHARQTKYTLENSVNLKQYAINSQRNVSEGSSTLLDPSVGKSSCSPSRDSDLEVSENVTKISSVDERPYSPCEDKGSSLIGDGKMQKLCSEISSISIDKQSNSEHFEGVRPNGLSLNDSLQPGSQALLWHDSERLQEHSSSSVASGKATTSVDFLTTPNEVSNLISDPQASVIQNLTSETEDDFNSQRLRDAIVVNQTAIPASSPLHLLNHLRVPLQPFTDADSAVTYSINPPTVNSISNECLTTNLSSASVASNGFLDHCVGHTSDQDCSMLLKGGQGNHLGNFDAGFSNFDPQPALDMGENNIISNILSLDLDSWDDSLTSPQTLAKLLRETDKQEVPVKMDGSWKGQNSNQSRFSFARQDTRNHLFDIEPSHGNISQTTRNPSFGQEFLGGRDQYLERIGNGFAFSNGNTELSDNLTSGHSIFSSSRVSLSRSQISAPPGFSTPTRPPPPGFPSHDRSDQSFNILKSGNHLVDTSSFLRNLHQASPSGNMSFTDDIEFRDPAILAVGKGSLPGGLNNSSLDMRPTFPVQSHVFENDSRLQLLMQRSLSPHQNFRYNEVRDNFSPPNDAYGFTSRHIDQSQASNHVPFSQFSHQQPRNTVVSNGPWDGWGELQGATDISMGELLRNDRHGINKFFGGYEDAKFRMTNSGDLYNRSFGM
ncbi:unnamed protein product [Amaranthus hypochondriacus]